MPWGELPKVVYTPEPIKTAPSPRPVVRFYSGWCTSYVASRRTVTWGGNAKYWYANAKAQGYKVGSYPQVKAIYVEPGLGSKGCKSCGHVSYVEKVEDDRFQVSEMNYVAFGKVSWRWIPISDRQLFIY